MNKTRSGHGVRPKSSRAGTRRIAKCSPPRTGCGSLTLGELEALAGALLPVLFALVLARVARKHPQFLELAAQFRVELDQSAGNAQLRRAGLTRRSAACGGDQNIEFIGRFRSQQRLSPGGTRGFAREIVIELAAVNLDVALARPQKHSGHRAFAATRTKMLNQCHLIS